MDNARIALAGLMRTFASAVNGITAATDDDRAQIDLTAKPGPTSGTIIGAFKHVGHNILIYEGQYTLGDPNTGPWIDIEPFSSSRRFEIPGLERGKDVWLRVRARNSNGAGPWSDPATTMVN